MKSSKEEGGKGGGEGYLSRSMYMLTFFRSSSIMGKKLAIRNVCVGGYKVIMAIFWVIEWISSNKLFSVSFLGRIEH